MPDRERTLVLAFRQFANHFLIEFLSSRSQFRVHLGEFVPDIGSLARIVLDVIKSSFVPESESRASHAGLSFEVIDVKSVRPVLSVVVSSPVERGAWVLRHLLNDPPPPAPPNVPQISRLNGQVLSTRERLLAHQEEAQCASCHRKIDPIGFGLENFNAAGKWRTEDSDGSGRQKKTWKIDASGAFHKGPAFNDYNELRDLIAEREEEFARGFTQHLIAYALGRPFGFTDEELANVIVSSAGSKEFAISEIVHSLVQNKAFRTK